MRPSGPAFFPVGLARVSRAEGVSAACVGMGQSELSPQAQRRLSLR